MNRLRSILSPVLIFLTLMSGSSFMVGIHLCGGTVQNIALFKKADGCEKEKQLPPCHRKMTKPCCEDETVFHEGQGFKNTLTQINIAAPFVADVIHAPVLIAEIISSASQQKQYYNYDPPLRSRDLTVSHQVFLI
jgi:hypothetical protein